MTAAEIKNMVLSPDQAGERVGRCGEVLREAARNGELPAIRLGRRGIFFLVRDVDRWWDQRTSKEADALSPQTLSASE